MATFFKWEIARADLAPLDSEIMELEGDAALTGPTGDLDGIVIDPVMAKRFEDLLADLRDGYGIAPAEGCLEQAITTPMCTYINALSEIHEPILRDAEHDHARVIRLPDTDEMFGAHAVILRGGDDMWRIAGLAVGPDIAVSPIYRALGLGSALVAAQILDNHGLQVWDHDRHGYSDGGAACVKRGLALAKSLAAARCEPEMPGSF